MNLIIHRGTSEIGGSCLELQSSGNRIIVDLGIPLVGKNKEKFDPGSLKGKSIAQLKAAGILPKVKGLYKDQAKGIDAIFISHCHLDHYGFLNYVHPDIPVYMSLGAERMIEASNLFLPRKTEGFKSVVMEKEKAVRIGDFIITGYLVDHSAFDALAFIIQSGQKRVFYSGDMRGHGRKSRLFEKMVKHPPKDIDCLIMEGTMLGKEKQKFAREEDIETELVKVLKNKKDITFLFLSSQNIDRLVSAYRACIPTNTLFVIDIYTAFILHRLADISARLPQYNWKNIRVKYFKSHAESLGKTKYKNLLYKFNSAKIGIDELLASRKKTLMILRDNSLFPIVVEKLENTEKATLIYSMWQGYLNEKLKSFCQEKGIKILSVHTSGHAVLSDLKRFINAFSPKTLIPMHTFEPEKFLGLHPNVKLLKDEEIFRV